MPITNDEKLATDEALGAFEAIDSVCVARLVYQTLLDAKISDQNPNGMGWKSASSLGHLIKEKAPWENITSVEDSIKAPIRMPLIKATDMTFRTQLPTVLRKLPEEHKQVLAHVLGNQMDADELANLTKLLYQTVVQTDFNKEKNIVDIFAKLYWAGWTWDELSRAQDMETKRRPYAEEILKPIVDACHGFFREAFANIFAVEEPKAEVPPEGEEKVTEAKTEDKSEEPETKSEETKSEETKSEETKSDAAEPMPVPTEPEFATDEEIATRTKEDEAKPQFRGGNKRKSNGKKKNAGKSDSDKPDAKADAEAKDDAEPESDKGQGDAEGNSANEKEPEAEAAPPAETSETKETKGEAPQ